MERMVNNMGAKRIAVIGAGAGGCSISGNMALAGHSVNLYELPRFEENITQIVESGGVEVTGTARTGFAKLARITTDMQEAVEDTSYIFVVTQSVAHEEIAKLLAPHIKTDHIIFVLPGTAGSLVFSKVFRDEGLKIHVDIAEALSLPYGCRRTGPKSVNVSRLLGTKIGKNGMGVFPSKNTERVVNIFNEFYPNTFPMGNVLEVALCNTNTIKHPPVSLLNIGRVEYSKGEFWFYREGITPSVEKVVEALDRETKPIFKKLGFSAVSVKQIDEIRYEKNWDDRHAAISEIGNKGPTSAKHRYFTEDVPVGMVLTSSIGKWLDIPTPTFDSIIHLVSVINDTDYWKQESSRTIEKLGLAKMSFEQLQRFLEEGSF